MDFILTCIWRFFFGEQDSTGCLLKKGGWWQFAFSEAHKFSRQITMFSFKTSFHQTAKYFVCRRQQAVCFFPPKNRQLEAVQYKIHSTNPVKILQSPTFHHAATPWVSCRFPQWARLCQVDIVPHTSLFFLFLKLINLALHNLDRGISFQNVWDWTKVKLTALVIVLSFSIANSPQY